MSGDKTDKFDHKAFVASLTSRPGIYQMLDKDGEVLYIGKARNLKNRVGSYFRASGLATKTMAMVDKIQDIAITVTSSDTEALLLEQNLIKSQRPPYNIVLRDDKSYPYILLTEKDTFPRLGFYRGSRKRSGRFFGPYPSANATRETLQILQKVFRVRQCEDSYFKNRSRPCLQYQIDRCTGPCVGLISPEDYERDVRYSTLFLQGKSDLLTSELTLSMEQAAGAQDYERAALIRDQIIDLRSIQAEQNVSNQGGDADILAATVEQTWVCVHVIYVRAGRIIGSKSFYPRARLNNTPEEVLAAFISQIYLGDDKVANIPTEIIVPAPMEDEGELQAALSYVAGRKIRLSQRVRGHRAKWVNLALTTATESLQLRLSNRQNTHKRIMALQESLGLDAQPGRIECFDISHTSGEGTVASCVVFDENGAVKADYRRFNIKDITAGDDYAAMEQALDRRFTRLSKGEGKIPEILLIDGGKGQLTQARKILEKFQLPEIQLLGIAKGLSRRAGQETLYLKSQGQFREIALPGDSPALLLLQQIRDEAHRFAITGHRQRRSKVRNQSLLEAIPGLGPKRRRALLRHFGGQQEIRKASEVELARVSGISRKLAENIYAYLHNIS
ncbi:MAG: excinuclease ABC subunit UvrC [Gammaproteobacteria bacterium]|nr:excinuclease ABC subunit UvrC [Gammaproteobacteria bacterium]MCY4357305.1 excinuclease ABC subunit UvrC [Gammaproteobacteria bacterium]